MEKLLGFCVLALVLSKCGKEHGDDGDDGDVCVCVCCGCGSSGGWM